MKNILLILLGVFVVHFSAYSQEKATTRKSNKPTSSFIGYLVDQTCGKRMVMDDVKKSDAKGSRHTRECGLDESCSAHGYGLVTGGKFFKFDAFGDSEAKKYLLKTSKEDNIKVEVRGTLDDNILSVLSIKDVSSPPSKRSKHR